ncbi:hypothetical protein C8Q76DRAFT_802992 [Earliella scabrosa]|nr:hypothetical protein C8Q76DRAFT_802992 [Earliella scabrosa]
MAQSAGLDATLGVQLIGTFFGTMLYGLVLHQAYRYARMFPADTLFIRLLVIAVVILVTFHTFITMHTEYYYLVSNYFNPKALNHAVWSFIAMPIAMSLIMFTSQVFFVYRVYLMGRPYRVIAGVAGICFLVEIAFAIVVLVVGLSTNSLAEFGKVNAWIAATFAVGVAGDTLLTMSLFGALYRARRHALTSSPPEPIINSIITLVINTGLLHDILNIVALWLTLTYPDTFFNSLTSIVNAKVYAITLLTVLNSRTLVVSQGAMMYDGGEHYGRNFLARMDSLASKERYNVPQVPTSSSAPPPVINISVVTELEEPRKGHVLDLEARGGRASIEKAEYIV